MAKRKGKVDLIEKTLDGEIEGTLSASSAAADVAPNDGAPNEVTAPESSSAGFAQPSAPKAKSFKLQFLGREYLEERFPKLLHGAERFAEEWITEGDFDYLAIPNPRAKEAIVEGLKNIRAVEKKVEQKVEQTVAEYSEKLAPYAKLAAPYAKLATERVEKLIHQLRR